MSTMERFRELRGMPFVKQGMTVELDGEKGRVSGANKSGNLQITFGGDQHSMNCHPTWELIYFNKSGDIIADYRQGKE